MSGLEAIIERLLELDAKRDAQGEFMVFRAPLYDDDFNPIEDTVGDGWELRQVVYVNLHTPDKGIVRQKAVNRTPASCSLKSDADFLAAAPEMMAAINALVAEREALQAENARLLRALFDAGIKAGELTSRLMDAEREEQRTRG